METIKNNDDSSHPTTTDHSSDASSQYADLVDIEDITIDSDLPQKARIQSFIQQIKNPYMFRCNGVVVEISFADTTVTIEERMEEYIRQRHRSSC